MAGWRPRPDRAAARLGAASELLRRAARRRAPQAALLQGEDWLRFLDGQARRDFSEGDGRLLLDGGFRRQVDEAQARARLRAGARAFRGADGAAPVMERLHALLNGLPEFAWPWLWLAVPLPLLMGLWPLRSGSGPALRVPWAPARLQVTATQRRGLSPRTLLLWLAGCACAPRPRVRSSSASRSNRRGRRGR